MKRETLLDEVVFTKVYNYFINTLFIIIYKLIIHLCSY